MGTNQVVIGITTCCIASDPTEDTERPDTGQCEQGRRGCIASDPTEDTERHLTSLDRRSQFRVASPPIRPRILKAQYFIASFGGRLSCIASDPTEDTERTPPPPTSARSGTRCIASDPTEDTESPIHLSSFWLLPPVASPPIRPRILKEFLQVGAVVIGEGLHRLRSDRGY